MRSRSSRCWNRLRAAPEASRLGWDAQQILLESERLPLSERVALPESIVTELDELTQLVADVVELAGESDRHEDVQPLQGN